MSVPVIPREALFGNPQHLAPTLSPDGSHVFFLAPDGGVMNVWTAPLDRVADARVVTHARRQGIRTFGLCHDDRTLCYLADKDGDESHRLYLVDLVTGEERCATPFPQVQTRILAHNQWHPTTMLLGLNLDRRHLHDVYRLDLVTGELAKVATNPGYLSWVIDTDLAVRGGSRMLPDGGLAIHLDLPGTDPTEPWLIAPYEDAMGTRVLGLSRDGSTLYLLSSLEANASRLLAVDMASGRQRLLAADPVYDVKQIEFDPRTREPQVAVFAKDRDEWVFLDEDHAADVARLRGELGPAGVGADLDIDRPERSGRLWTVAVVRADAPVRYYIYDRSAGRLTYLFSHQPELERYRLAPMEPFTCRARDGVTLHGYVTWPADEPRRDLPAVLNVHGGPWARNSYCFDEEAQLLANRGYACIQVNFRGSVGYGKEFRNLGAKQWAAAMHEDLLDSVEYLASTGAIDPERVAIMGCSYGGYAALVGAAFSPDVFVCAVDLCGPSNLLTMLAAGAPQRTPLQAFMYANVGDPEREADLLWQRSPLSRIDDIRIPVLIAHGANDVRVTQAEAEQMVTALRARQIPCEYLLFADDGHGLSKPANREVYYAAVEAFLARHLVRHLAPRTVRVGQA